VLAAVPHQQHVGVTELGVAVRAALFVVELGLLESTGFPVRPLDFPGDEVFEPAEDGPAVTGRLVGAEAVVGLDLLPTPGAALGGQDSWPEDLLWSGPGDPPPPPTRDQWTISPSWMTKAVRAVCPVPGPQSPPGRAVSSKVAVVTWPSVLASTSFAPQGSELLKETTSPRLRRRTGGVPFWAVLGSAK
jgi:hypothetical protein